MDYANIMPESDFLCTINNKKAHAAGRAVPVALLGKGIADPPVAAYSNRMVERIGYTRAAGSAKGPKKTSATSASGFSDALSAAQSALEGTEIQESAGLSAASAIAGLFALQEVDASDADRRKAVKRGRLTLEALEHLRDALLIGSLPHSAIARLEAAVRSERAVCADPALAGILDEIELRAAVELAKLEVAQARQQGEAGA